MPEYLIILLILFLIALFVHHKYKLSIYTNKKQAIHVTLNLFLLGLVWDYFAVSRGHWMFPGDGLIGANIVGLPIEEFLFFLIVPYVALVTFKFHEKEDSK